MRFELRKICQETFHQNKDTLIQRRALVKHKWTVLMLTVFLGLSVSAQSLASVEWTTSRTLKLEKPPIDMAFSKDGRWVFILTEEGTVLIYSANGKLMDKMSVGAHVDGIDAGPREDILFLKSRKNKTVEELSLDFVYDIDVSGSPFEGPGDAPVVITVFNDYQ